MDWQVAIDGLFFACILALAAAIFLTRSPSITFAYESKGDDSNKPLDKPKQPHVHGPLKLRSQHEEAGRIVLVKECTVCGDLIRDKQE